MPHHYTDYFIWNNSLTFPSATYDQMQEHKFMTRRHQSQKDAKRWRQSLIAGKGKNVQFGNICHSARSYKKMHLRQNTIFGISTVVCEMLPNQITVFFLLCSK